MGTWALAFKHEPKSFPTQSRILIGAVHSSISASLCGRQDFSLPNSNTRIIYFLSPTVLLNLLGDALPEAETSTIETPRGGGADSTMFTSLRVASISKNLKTVISFRNSIWCSQLEYSNLWQSIPFGIVNCLLHCSNPLSFSYDIFFLFGWESNPGPWAKLFCRKESEPL